MVRLRNGTLVSLLYNPANQQSYGAWSHDKGQTWTASATFSETIPQLEIAPALTSVGDVVVAVWVDADDHVNHAVSENSGKDWDLA